MNLSEDYLSFLNTLIPPLIKTNVPVTKEAISSRQHYRKYHREIRLRKLLVDIAVRGRVPKNHIVQELGAQQDQILKSWLQYKSTGKPISFLKAKKMKALISSFV